MRLAVYITSMSSLRHTELCSPSFFDSYWKNDIKTRIYMKNTSTINWYVTLCTLPEVHRRFRGTKSSRYGQRLAGFLLRILLDLKTEEVGSSETSTDFHRTRCCTPDDITFNGYCHESGKSNHNLLIFRKSKFLEIEVLYCISYTHDVRGYCSIATFLIQLMS
jgi:hypothetical protein